MTIIITIQNRELSPGKLMNAFSKYLEMRRDLGYDKVRWEEDNE